MYWPAGWRKPASLDLLKDSPINCLVVASSAGGAPGQTESMVAEARRRGLAVVRLVAGGSESFGSELIPLRARDRVPPSADWPIVASSDSLWPRLRPMTETGASAGPTGDPWLDSNPWRVRSLRAGHPGRQVWLAHSPNRASSTDYLRAIADAAMAGGRWIVTLDDDLRRINQYLRFFEEHAEWRNWVARARLGIVQDWNPKTAVLSGENQNLLSRRHMPYRVIERRDLSPATVQGLDAVIAVDLEPPAAAERQILQDFAQAGGLVVAGPVWKAAAASTKPYAVEAVGKGRIAVYAKAVADPFALTLDVLNLMGRDNLGLRLFNVASIISYLTEDQTGKRALLQLVNYADSPLERVTARVSGDFRRARLHDPEAVAAVDLPLERRGAGVEFTLPKVSIYAAVLLE